MKVSLPTVLLLAAIVAAAGTVYHIAAFVFWLIGFGRSQQVLYYGCQVKGVAQIQPLALLADDSSLTFVERNGSFGLVALIVLAAMGGMVWLFRWIRSDVVPRIFAHLEAERQEREKQRAEHADQLAKRDEICEQMAQAVADLVQEVKLLHSTNDQCH